MAERANRDSNGQQIVATYITKIELSGENALKVTYGDGHHDIVAIQ